MLKFLLRRIATGVFTIWVISVLIFALYYLVPNNVARRMAGHNATPTTIKLITQRLGLDDPVWQQYLRFVGKALHGDLGTDYYFQLPVSQVIKETFPVTLSVIVGAAIIWLVIGVASGVVSAVHPRSFADRSVTVLSLLFYSIPVFVLGLTLIYFLYFKLTVAGLPIFPPGGYKPLSAGINQWFFHMILP